MTHIWKIKIKGNSMAGLFPDKKELQIQVGSDITTDYATLELGKVIILRKREIPGNFPKVKKSISQARRKGEGKISERTGQTLIIHRIVGKFSLQSHLYFLEKGDNDCFPKLCTPENILGIVMDIKGHPESQIKLKPGLWQERNRKLLKFYQMVGKMYVLIEGGKVSQRQGIIKKIVRKGFWFTLYLVCSFFDLKGK